MTFSCGYGHTMLSALKPSGRLQSILAPSPASPPKRQYVYQSGSVRIRNATQSSPPGWMLSRSGTSSISMRSVATTVASVDPPAC
jgi:hypothetical protein